MTPIVIRNAIIDPSRAFLAAGGIGLVTLGSASALAGGGSAAKA